MPLPRPCRIVPSGGAPVGSRRARSALPMAVAALLVGVVGLIGVVGLAVSAAGPAAADAGSCSGPLAPGQIRVVIVVDPGETGPRPPRATCLVVAAGTAGSKILAQRASELGLPAPRYAGSGLLCGLDGFPVTDCPVNDGGVYAYWAYFNGAGGSWSYGHDNPFVRRMVDGEIMGWRFTTGSNDGQAPTPRIAPGSSLFPPLTPAVTSPPPPATAAAPGPPGGGSAPVGGAEAPTGADAPTPAGEAATADPAAGGASGPGPSSTAAGSPGDDGTASVLEGEALASVAASGSGSDPGRWVGLAVGAAAVAAVAVGAVTRSRSRARAGAGS